MSFLQLASGPKQVKLHTVLSLHESVSIKDGPPAQPFKFTKLIDFIQFSLCPSFDVSIIGICQILNRFVKNTSPYITINTSISYDPVKCYVEQAGSFLCVLVQTASSEFWPDTVFHCSFN
jgi:hypothetical protein